MAAQKEKTLGERLIDGAEEALRFMRGQDTGARVYEVTPPDAKKIRKKLGLSQEEFAQRFHLSPGTIRNWEQGVRAPEGPALVLLRVIEHDPEAVVRALQATRRIKQVDPDRVRPAKYRGKKAGAKQAAKRARSAPAGAKRAARKRG